MHRSRASANMVWIQLSSNILNTSKHHCITNTLYLVAPNWCLFYQQRIITMDMWLNLYYTWHATSDPDQHDSVNHHWNDDIIYSCHEMRITLQWREYLSKLLPHSLENQQNGWPSENICPRALNKSSLFVIGPRWHRPIHINSNAEWDSK